MPISAYFNAVVKALMSGSLCLVMHGTFAPTIRICSDTEGIRSKGRHSICHWHNLISKARPAWIEPFIFDKETLAIPHPQHRLRTLLCGPLGAKIQLAGPGTIPCSRFFPFNVDGTC